MDYGFIACIPVIVLIVGILITKKMMEMAIISSVLAGILMYKGDFFNGYLERMYSTISDETYMLVLIILMGFGAIIELAQASGSLNGFEKAVVKYANTPKKAMVATWVMGFLVFLDDYLNILTSGFAMRNITDANKIPREHLALAINSLGGRLCVLIPITSWSAFIVAAAKPYGVTMGTYIQSIPFMFLPIISVICALLLALGILPKVGEIKKAYARVAAGGPLREPENGETVEENTNDDTEEKVETSPLFFFIPLIVLVAVTIILGTKIEWGIMAGLLCQFIMYVGTKKLSAKEFFETAIVGFQGMMELAFVILIVFMTAKCSLEMGMAEFLISTLVRSVPAGLLPVLIFGIVCLIGLTADSWVNIALSVPIFMPMALEAGIPVPLAVGAITSAVVFGSMYCLFADSLFMTSACTGISNPRLVKIFTPYVAAYTIITAVLYIVFGFIMC